MKIHGKLHKYLLKMRLLSFLCYMGLKVYKIVYNCCISIDASYTDPSKCINDQTLRSDTEFCRTSLLKLSDQIVRPNPPRSECESPLSDS